jgi:hypothetical protein
MAIKWYHNAKTGEIESYQVDGSLTDFCRGTLMAYGDYLTTGFRSKEEARAWAKDHGACIKCRCSRKPDTDGKCACCGEVVIFAKNPDDDDSRTENYMLHGDDSH